MPGTNTRTFEVLELGRLGEVHRRKGELEQAEAMLRQAVSIAEQNEPTDRATLARALNGLGLVCKDVAKYDEARAHYERALALFLRDNNPNPHDLATIYHNLGGIEHVRGRYAEAEPAARRAVEIRRAATPRDEEALAADMVALAAILDGLEEFNEAGRLYEDALAILNSDPAANAREIAVALNDLGANRLRRGDLEEAETHLERAVSMKRGALGDEHHELAVSLNNLGYLYRKKGETERAARLFAEAVSILEKSLGHDHPRTIGARENLCRCRNDERGCQARYPQSR